MGTAMRTAQRSPRKAGRPPAGIGGDRVADYPQVSLRLPPHVRELLAALSTVRDQPHWRIMMEALEAYVMTLPAPERTMVEELVRRGGK